MKKNEKNEIAKTICSDYSSCCFCDCVVDNCQVENYAESLVRKGYGNIEQALTEFAEILKSHFHNYFESQYIDETLRRFLKNE